MCFGGGGGKSNNKASERAAADARAREEALFAQQQADREREAAEARRIAEAKSARLREGMANIEKGFGQFNDDYFGGISDRYKQFYRPQLEEQKTKAQDQILFNLARSGLLNSSERANAYGDLEKAYGARDQEISSNAIQQANEARRQIEAQRSSLMSQLNATGGDEVTSAAFLGDGGSNLVGRIPVQAPTLPTYSPLGDLFSGVTSVLANDARVASARGADSFLQSVFRKNVGGSGTDRYVG